MRHAPAIDQCVCLHCPFVAFPPSTHCLMRHVYCRLQAIENIVRFCLASCSHAFVFLARFIVDALYILVVATNGESCTVTAALMSCLPHWTAAPCSKSGDAAKRDFGK